MSFMKEDIDQIIKYGTNEIVGRWLDESIYCKFSPTCVEPLICNEQRPPKTKELKKLKPKHSQPFWSNNWRNK